MKNKLYDNNWELLPGIGLGNVTFLMNRVQVSAFDDRLGKVTSESRPADMKHHLLDTFDLLRDFFTEADLETAMEAMEATNRQRGDVLTEYREAGLILEYEDGKLTEFFADDRARQLHFKQVPVFSSNPLDLVREMAAALNETPLIKDDEIVFFRNNIYLYSFLRKDFEEGDAKNRSIAWRKKPRLLGVDPSGYTRMKVV